MGQKITSQYSRPDYLRALKIKLHCSTEGRHRCGATGHLSRQLHGYWGRRGMVHVAKHSRKSKPKPNKPTQRVQSPRRALQSCAGLHSRAREPSQSPTTSRLIQLPWTQPRYEKANSPCQPSLPFYPCEQMGLKPAARLGANMRALGTAHTGMGQTRQVGSGAAPRGNWPQLWDWGRHRLRGISSRQLTSVRAQAEASMVFFPANISSSRWKCGGEYHDWWCQRWLPKAGVASGNSFSIKNSIYCSIF